MSKFFDFLVIGGGSGGIASARRAAQYGAKVAVIESNRLGGTCVNVGCVPKKIMWNAASIAETLTDASYYGFNVGNPCIDWKLVKEKRDAYVLKLNGIYQRNLQNSNIEIIHGYGHFVGPKTIKVGDQTFSGKHILIATGSRAFIPDIPGAKEYGKTSDGFFEMTYLPKKIAIVGAGYIAIELAGVLRLLGSEVSIFIRSNEFLRSFDSSIREGVLESYREMGIEIVCDSNVQKLSLENNKKTIHFKTNQNTVENSKDGYDEVLFAVGRESNVDKLGLENTNVQCLPNGFIKTDEFQNTTAEGVYALGDIIGAHMLTPVAIAAGRKLSDRLFDNKNNSKLNYENIPSVIFSHPCAGSIGLAEHEAVEKYGKDNIKIYQSKFVNMYYGITDHKPKTHYKLVCLLPEEKVIGLHMVGKASDEILQGFGVAIKMGATKADFDNCVAIHPTAAEELVTMK